MLARLLPLRNFALTLDGDEGGCTRGRPHFDLTARAATSARSNCASGNANLSVANPNSGGSRGVCGELLILGKTVIRHRQAVSMRMLKQPPVRVLQHPAMALPKMSRILAIVEAEGKLVKVQRQVLAAHDVIRADHAELEQAPGGFPGVVCPTDAKPAPPGAAGNTVEQYRLKPCRERSSRLLRSRVSEFSV